ncbi:hypothetical protein E2C01_070933 [Portunus trituberculatus]|uniref:Uncharacterized protein n=1 Tax=Portunus trituberculatus TaxID=210409 RepID=A0A5B7I6N5_PORTR|nr:hypothetical protein [Portunus trituberculatus]
MRRHRGGGDSTAQQSRPGKYHPCRPRRSTSARLTRQVTGATYANLITTLFLINILSSVGSIPGRRSKGVASLTPRTTSP